MADERRDRTRKAPSLRSGSTDVSARRSAVPSRSAGMSGSSGSRTRGQYASTGTQSGATRPRYARPESDSLEGSGSPSRKIAKNGELKTQTKRTVSKKRRKKRTRLNYKAILKLAALLLAIVFIILIICNRFVIKISMNGDSEVTVKYGENYSDAGAEAVYKGTIFGFIKRGINVDTISSVDTGKPGDYEVRYSAVYKKAEGEALRTVHVVDDVPPEIILGNTEITTVKGLSWDESYMATDNADGDITSRVKVSGDVDMDTPGTYTVTYTVSDSSGNTATASKTITVLESNPNNTGENGPKIVALTFDDGPYKYTEQLLDILDKYNVKATFFVTNQFPDYINMIKKEAEAGHTVAVHTYSHDYETVYTSTSAYWDDFEKMNDIIEDQTGKRSDMFRFPGGSSNTISYNYCPGIMTELSQQAVAKGLDYVDWNVSSGDAGGATTSDAVYQNVISELGYSDVSVVLMHDIHPWTLGAIEDIIIYCIENGYTMIPLSKGITTCHHGINN